MAEAVDADSAYLIEIHPGISSGIQEGTLPPVPNLDLSNATVWNKDGDDTLPESLLYSVGGDGAPAGLGRKEGRQPHATAGVSDEAEENHVRSLAIPILSEEDRFLGYLGIDRIALPASAIREHGSVLSIFGDLLASYLTRVHAEQALGESQERWQRLVNVHPEPLVVTLGDRIQYANKACKRLLGIEGVSDMRRYALHDFIPAHQMEAVEHQVAAQLSQPSPQPFEHDIVRLDGEERTVESVSVRVQLGGAMARQTVMRDVTEYKRSEERYRTFVQTISEGVWRVDLTQPISMELTPERQVELLEQRAFMAECNAMMVRFLRAESPEAISNRSLSEMMPEIGRQLFQSFVRGGYRLENYEFSSARRGHPTRHFTLNAAGRAERGQLIRIWGSCSEVTERVNLERRMVELLEEEQERIGQDLHDSVGQLLTGIRMLGENLADRLGASGGAELTTLRRMLSFADEATERVRALCRGLVPPHLYQEGLAVSLEALVDGMSDLSATCTFIGDRTLNVEDRGARLQLYRIAQEAMNNAFKHADASNIVVRLEKQEHHLLLEIHDDGCGFEVGQAAPASVGLYSMHRRAGSIRAHLKVNSILGEGTHVRVLFPLCTSSTADSSDFRAVSSGEVAEAA